MILKRWEDVKALRDAFDDLVDRMRDIVEESLQKVSVALSERGLLSDFDPKRPSLWFWKEGWETRRKEPGIYFEVFDFVPSAYGKAVEDHPSIWLITEAFAKLKMQESSEDFGKALRSALAPEVLKKWNHPDVDLSDSPLGKDCDDVTNADRVTAGRQSRCDVPVHSGARRREY